MLELRVTKGEAHKGEKFALPAHGSVTIGRDSSCDIKLSSKGISKRHCRLTGLSGSRIEVEDLGSANGTFVNGVLIKKHILKVGDSLNIHDFTLQVCMRAPELVASSASGNFFDAEGNPAPEMTLSFVDKRNPALRWLEANVFPLADSLSEKFDLRFLMVVFFIIWSILIISFTASPFRQKANERVTEQAAEVAKLYARQLARVNQQAVIDQRYRDLIAELDARPGQTPGLLNAMILDATSSQILAPAEFFGQGLPNPFAAAAVNQDQEFVQVDSDGTIYASTPLKIGTPQGNKTVATAFVVFNGTEKVFSIAALLNQIVDSLLKALLFSALFLLFVYRWVEGTLLALTQKMDTAMKKSESTVTMPTRWPALQNLIEQVSAALGRAAGGDPAVNAHAAGGAHSAWAMAAVNNSAAPAAAFNHDLQVTAWNPAMEQVIGIRASMAVGSDISGASRDFSFESMVRELAASGSAAPWTPQQRPMEFSGRRFMASFVAGQGVYLLNLNALEDG